ncbi:MAG: phospholipase D family protein [Bacteroidia bacterium]
MSKFVTGKELIDTVDNIIWDAEKILLIVSPFIKLDDYFKRLFDKHVSNPELHMIIVFGKNETDVKKSFNQSDFDFFKQFLNISIVYAPNLHAKYYGNEKKGLITSINFYDASFKNNVEFGVYSEQTIFNSFTDHFIGNPDWDAWTTCKDLADKSDVVFVKRPVYQEKKMIISLGKAFVKSEVLADNTEYFYKGKSSGYKSTRLADFKSELSLDEIKPSSEEYQNPERQFAKVEEKKISYQTSHNSGYCIRTGSPIPFKPNRPFTYEAWSSWVQWSNPDFQEKYCHKTGKLSYGKTSMRSPILYNE